MIGKLTKGTGARGLLDYLLAPKDHKGAIRPRVEIVGGTFAGQTAREIASEFGALHALRPRLGVHVVHESLRLPDDEPEPQPDTLARAAAIWCDTLGFQSWCAVAHGDGHIHIAASRIVLDETGTVSVVSDSQDYKRSEQAIRAIERDLGLRQVASSHLLAPEAAVDHTKAITREQIAFAEVTGQAPPAIVVQEAITAMLARGVSLTEFLEGLEEVGIAPRPNFSGGDVIRLNGFAYELDGIAVTAKALGRGFTLANMLKKGLNYDPARDDQAIRAAADRRRQEAAIGLERAGGVGSPAGDLAALEDGGRPGAGADEPDRHGGGQGRPGSEDGHRESSDSPGRPAPGVALDRPSDDLLGAYGIDSDSLGDLVAAATADLERADRLAGDRDGVGPDELGRATLFPALTAHLAAAVGRAGREIGGFVEALGADAFEVMVLSVDDESVRPVHRTWTAEECLAPKNVGWLRAQNSDGLDICIRPIDRRLVLVDDLGAPAVERLAATGFAPAAVVETSPDSFQAWVRIGDGSMPEPTPEEATGMARSFIKTFGADPGAAQDRQFGRLPGFTNRKVIRLREGRSPWVTIRQAAGVVAESGAALLAHVQDQIRTWRAARAVTLPSAPQATPVDQQEAARLYLIGLRKVREAAAAGVEGDFSGSGVDFRAAGFALRHGAAAEDVVQLIMQHTTKERGDMEGYARLTVRKLIDEPDVPEPIEAHQLPDDLPAPS